jgi:hypothetical protein
METTSGSSFVGVLFPVEKDGKEGLGGARPSLGGALSLFAEVVRLEGLVKLRIPSSERH